MACAACRLRCVSRSVDWHSLRFYGGFPSPSPPQSGKNGNGWFGQRIFCFSSFRVLADTGMYAAVFCALASCVFGAC